MISPANQLKATSRLKYQPALLDR